MEFRNLKEMLSVTKDVYGDKAAYKLNNGKQIISHRDVRDMIDGLGTELLSLGFKNERIAIIGENRYEWEISYLAVVCGVGTVVPLDKALPDNELENLICESKVSAIFASEKYVKFLEKLVLKDNNDLKVVFSFENDFERLINDGAGLIADGNRDYVDVEVDEKKMSIMLFTSGTTSKSKIVMLSHENLCENLKGIDEALDVDSDDVFLSVLPVHHVFECTVGFLFSLYKGACTVFSRGVRHIADDLRENEITIMACVPALYNLLLNGVRKKIENDGMLDEIKRIRESLSGASLEERREAFSYIHDIFGGKIKLLISGAAALDKETEETYRDYGFNIVQGYGLTETSPVVAVGTKEAYRLGSIGKVLPGLEVRVTNVNDDGIGELWVRGKSVMLGYYENEKANEEVFDGEWFDTGDLARIDEDGYIFICGRKKSVIVLKNGKNIFPEEMENLVNRIDGVSESFIYGKQLSDDVNDIKINVKIVYDRNRMKEVYGVSTDESILGALREKVKEVNGLMPKYKAIRGVTISEEPLIKTTTNKIKRQANLEAMGV